MSRLPPLPALRDFIHMYRLKAKKILSQNYIMDMNLNRKIVRAAGVQEGDNVCEIGPGPGGITRAILEARCKRLDVVEIDHRFLPPLQTDIGEIWRKSGADEPIVEPWHDSSPNCHIIGNLPFNVASPLIIRLLKDMSYRRGAWRYGRVPLTLTFQLEVAQRICSPIACATRSRISIMAQYVSEPKLVFKISGSCFVPRPDVDVGVVKFVPRKYPLIGVSFEVIEKLCRQVFHYRQKYMIKGLKTLYPKEIADEMAHSILKTARIDPTTTSIKLGIEQFADMAMLYEKQCREMPGLFLYDYTKPKRTVEMLASEPNAMPPECIYDLVNIPRDGVKLSQIT